ncbi:response regulator [Pseudoalteromonas sp. SR44-5]|jgi:CheY-like chemotaxis protein|uniref:Response regulator n=3 Tax=root TaxID=1 RepID=A0ABY3F9K5_9GAMM|nr:MULTISPECIES: response regulator [Pseudoalteromonas]MBB1293136.1 response regulator [Pseudoalteromonas sp. SR41-4]MBB1302154.1 response regulator [Pseudoalteromonas sp. SR44-8]MBB1310609.1 response regulator [Pseudoalteromonas sp. SR41-8]MBB1333656.1 response regulator [Pseudoalteromonas sp. SR41-6]MBB1341568.1 response regulator [Pseudoalteromonas sp. SR45-6]|tara:strand:- start:9589 stop:10050 length:462 start_codon:yes stop_codon:yes gene_type:complete|eukprot:GHVR01065805.1.p1 GENE.GHVR01065805.1~~GHVR01065805.1.p1  ORF type:complete len:154 (+),score=18.31 GHVR01065805.1:167-628(+)
MPFSKVKPITILMADDDEDDRLLTQDALAESRVLNELYFVEDGVELLEYLERKGKFEDKNSSPRPGLILLDLNMPRMDGREALQAIKGNSNLKGIPVVILTTSKQEEDMVKGYDLGAASYITKPVTFDGLVELMKTLGKYWVEFVELPSTFND